MRLLPDQRAAGLTSDGHATTGRAGSARHSARAAGAALRAYGEDLAATGAAQTGGAFTDDPAADAFIKAEPAAFVIGVLFTQGIPAERAWAGPYRLAARLGHFDLEKIASDPQAVADAVAAPPALHRFVRTLPGWIVSAARRIDDLYGGDAREIWRPGTSTTEVIGRLRGFDGIGPKKAVMAAEILRRYFGVDLTGSECGSVAYDVHVRRVFLRTGLIDEDSPKAVSDAAAAICPESPGVLDLATWLVGREYCHPRDPRCEACRIGPVCLMRTDRSAAGVGVRGSGHATGGP